MLQRWRIVATVFVVGILSITSQGRSQDSCCRLVTDLCCNRAAKALPCYICDLGWPATECCWLDIGEYTTQTVKCGFSTGWFSGSFWHFTRFDGCLWGARTCDIDEGCSWDLQWHYADCSDYGHDPGVFDCPTPPEQ